MNERSTRREYLTRGREMRITRSVSTLLELLAAVSLILGHRTSLKDEYVLLCLVC